MPAQVPAMSVSGPATAMLRTCAPAKPLPACRACAFSSRADATLWRRNRQLGPHSSCPTLLQSSTLQTARSAHSVLARAAADGASDASGSNNNTPVDSLVTAAGVITNLFPLWVVLAAVGALLHPPLFLWIQTSWVTWGLAATMLGTGLTMRVSDFTAVFQKMPALLLLGLMLQYTVMPTLGFVFSRYAGLEHAFATGVALLSACPGGTASNIVAFIAKGEMGLSIMMTTASTLTAIVATPAITKLLAGALVPVDAKALFMSTLQMVLAPVLLGTLINQRFPVTVAKCARFTPAIASLLVAAIVGSTLAHSAAAVRESGLKLVAAIAALHASGFAIGYWLSRALGLSEKIARTNSIEVGMQNSALGAVMAKIHFADPLVAVPCAISACTHSVLGSLLAGYWARKPEAV